MKQVLMDIVEAIETAQKRRDQFYMDVHVLRDELGEYFTVLDINLGVYMESRYQLDKKIYHTAWYLTE